MEYLKRTADEHLSLLLASSGAVLIEGPKWCGKTTTAEQQANSTISLQDPDMRDKYQASSWRHATSYRRMAGGSRAMGFGTSNG